MLQLQIPACANAQNPSLTHAQGFAASQIALPEHCRASIQTSDVPARAENRVVQQRPDSRLRDAGAQMYGSRRRSSTPLMGQLGKRRQRNSRAPLTGMGPDARDRMRANLRSSQHALLERSDGPRRSANRQFPAEQPRMQTFVAEAPTPIS